MRNWYMVLIRDPYEKILMRCHEKSYEVLVMNLMRNFS